MHTNSLGTHPRALPYGARLHLCAPLWLATLLLAMLWLPTGHAAETPRAGCDSCLRRIDSLEQPVALSGHWLFTREDDLHNKDIGIDTAQWRLLKAPGHWKDAYGDGNTFRVGWYRGEFDFNPALIGQPVVLLLNAYMSRVRVYLDGVEIYHRPDKRNIQRYFSTQPIPVLFTITQPRQVLSIRIETPLMIGIYQLPFELRRYSADDQSLAWWQFWGGELRLIVSYVVLFFGLFFLLVYSKTRARLYLIAALTALSVFPFYAAPADYLLKIFPPEPLLALHYSGLYTLFFVYLFCQFFYRFTPRLNWLLGVLYGLLALTLSVSLSQEYLPLFQSARSAFLLTGALLTVLAFYQVLRGALQRRPGANVLLAGTSVLLITALHDVLLGAGLIASTGLTFVGAIGYLATMLYVASSTFANTFVENQQLIKELGTINDNLEGLVAERTEALSASIAELQQAQASLVQAEKLASLGALVAGVAHELNTPIGNALTSASTLQERLQDITRSAADGQLRKSTLSDFLSDGSAIAELITRSCERAANLVSSFKQVAVDQTSEQRRQFDLRALVDDIVTTLRPTLKHLPWHITIEVPSGLHCDSYPGPLGQVISNLIQNAMLHAFTGRHQGNLCISASARSNGEIEMSFDDNGIGMSPAVLARIFDPFFTTRLGSGGSGLGLSVSHNIAIGVLGGSLSARSHLGQGSSFILTFAAHAAATQPT